MAELDNTREISSMLNIFIQQMEVTIKEFNEIIENQSIGDNSRSTNLKLLKELITLDNISNSNYNRLKDYTSRLKQSGELVIANHQQKRELQALLIKSSTSFEILSDIIGNKDKRIVNLVDNTLNRINDLELLSAS